MRANCFVIATFRCTALSTDWRAVTAPPEAEPNAARREPEVTSVRAQSGELPFKWPRKIFTKLKRVVQQDKAKKKCLFAGLVFSQDMLMDSVLHVHTHTSQDRRKCAHLHPV